MKQLALLKIRKQAAPKAPAIHSNVVRSYVSQKLAGFAERQAARVKRRQDMQERYKETGPKTKPDQIANMRQIKVSFRAVFTGPIGPLNPMGLKIPGEFPVEIFGAGQKWQARSIGKMGNVYTRLSKFPTVEGGKQIIAQAFTAQVEEWQVWGTPAGEPYPRLLSPDEIKEVPPNWYLKTPEDYTHIIHAAVIPPGARMPPAACGASVLAGHFISTKANIQPTCQACAEVWRQHYA